MTWKKWAGVGMILFSGVWFAGIIIVPFTAFSLATKAIFGLVFFALMEVFFWVGSVIVGKQAISHFWDKFKKKRATVNGPNDQVTGSSQPLKEKK